MRVSTPFAGSPKCEILVSGDPILRLYVACLYVVVWVVKWRHILDVGCVFTYITFTTIWVADKPYMLFFFSGKKLNLRGRGG